ncbi:MAG TPA: UvrD-helicase domain-containing protein [Anaeromyxobacteraceae bacterium]|nr:UvrD-helicase domain-containing protein [Anaeromyxobacteraceae bacterium]
MSGPMVWSKAALALFDLQGPTAVSAGAGSGKTTCLVELCLRLLSGEALGVPCDPAELVAITFTEKAAAELDERLRAAVALRARVAPAGSEDGRIWRARLDGLDRMAIGTIHGFAGRLLREHALEAGLDPELQVLDEETAGAWRRDAARAALLAALDAGHASVQHLAASYGAGGRREGLADAVADLARERATFGERDALVPAPDDVAGALGARQAAVAAAEALLAGRREVKSATGVAAMEALAAALGALGEDRDGPLRAQALSRAAALAEAVRSWRVGSSEAARAGKAELLRTCEAFAPLAAEVLAASQKRAWCELVTATEARYATRKRGARAVDFDDLLVGARDLLRSDPGLLRELRSRLRALLVDEYQDVNPVQDEIFQLLSGGGSDGAAPKLVAVGDLKQSIYRFRGADVAVFRGVIERFETRPPGRVLHLAENHRSSPAVLELVNEVFARCMQPAGGDPRPYELSFREEDRLVARRPPGDALACELLEDGEGGSAPERRAREAIAIAARIAALAGGAGVAVRERGDGKEEQLRRPRLADMAILFRRLTQVEEYVRALRAAGIPYRLGRGGGFYQAPEVRDLGELLQTLAAPDDALAWAAVLRSPWCGVCDGVLFALARRGLGTLARRTPEEVVEELEGMLAPLTASGDDRPDSPSPLSVAPPEVARSRRAPTSTSGETERLLRFLRVWHQLRGRVDRMAVHELLRSAMDALDLEAAHLSAPDGERRLANLRKALGLAERFASTGGAASGFAARLRMMAARPPREPEAEVEAADAVALLSVHQAKGLEWPIVFVPDLGASSRSDARRALRDASGALAAAFLDADADCHHVTRSLQLAREEARRAAAAESRRLLYVALTRARDRLVLSGEAARGGDTWRGLVEAGLAARPELVVRIPVEQAANSTSTSTANTTAKSAPLPDPLPAARGEGAGRSNSTPIPTRTFAPPRLAPPPALRAVRVAVTELAEHARCPRRVYLARHLGLPERGPPGGATQDDPDRASARGTLAHAMLSEVDLAASPLERRPQLQAVALRRGYDPGSPGVRRIQGDVARFLESEPGRRLGRAAQAGQLRREVPFLLRLDGDGAPSCYLVGAIDALVEDRRGIEVIDFKYALARPGAAERYRLQLLAYALAAGRAFPEHHVIARLQFLRGGCAAVDVTPTTAELRRFAREAPRLAALAYTGADLGRTPHELGRDEQRCRGEGCGYVARCFPPAPRSSSPTQRTSLAKLGSSTP